MHLKILYNTEAVIHGNPPRVLSPDHGIQKSQSTISNYAAAVSTNKRECMQMQTITQPNESTHFGQMTSLCTSTYHYNLHLQY